MGLQDNVHRVYEDEISFYDYWIVIIKWKYFIIGLFLISLSLVIILHMLMPEFYKGEAVLKINTSEIVKPWEIVSIVNKPNTEKIKMIFPKSADIIKDLKVEQMRNSNDKLKVTIESKTPEGISTAFTDFIEYISNMPIFMEHFKKYAMNKKEALLNKQKELQLRQQELQEERDELRQSITGLNLQVKGLQSFLLRLLKIMDRIKKIRIDNSLPEDADNVLNSFTIDQQILDYEREKLDVEERIHNLKIYLFRKELRLKQNKVEGMKLKQELIQNKRDRQKIDTENMKATEIIDPPFIPAKSVGQDIIKKITLSSIASLFTGIFLAFFIEYIKKAGKRKIS